MNFLSLTKQRYTTLVLACLINVCAGTNYAWSIFAQPLAEHLSKVSGEVVSSATLALAFSLLCIFSPLSMVVSGRFADRYGPRYILMLAGCFIAIAFVGCSISQSVTEIIIFYGVFCGCGIGCAFNTSMGNILKFFPDHSGVASGLVSTSFGASSVIVPPLAVYLLEHFGVEGAFRILGCLFGGIVLVSGYLTTRCPENYRPKNWVPTGQSNVSHDIRTSQMIRTKIFWMMFALAFCGCFPAMMLISQAARIAQIELQLTIAQSAWVVSFLAFSNMSGRIVGGSLSDRYGRIQIISVGIALSLIGSLSLYLSLIHI